MSMVTWILLGFVGIVVLGVLYLAACRIAASRRKHSKGDSDDDSSEKSKEKKSAKKEHSGNDHGGHARHGSGSDSFIRTGFKLVLLVLLGALVVATIVEQVPNRILVWLLNTGSNGVFGTSDTSHVQYQPSPRVSDPSVREAKVIVAANEERNRIEAEQHSVAFNYEVSPAWIHNPPGYYATFEVQNGNPVDVQCSSSKSAPARNDRGLLEHQCPKDLDDPDAESVVWWRPLAVSPEEGVVNVSYRFHYYVGGQ